MKPSELKEYLPFALKNDFSVLLTSPPGCGKTVIAKEVSASIDYKIVMSHPVVKDPTNYQGLPFPRPDGTAADFLPFGDLYGLINATEDTAFIIDDLGQAPLGVQAACMQVVLEREINGHKVSDKVRFIAATNRPQDLSGVKTMIESLKSRFLILELVADAEDWAKWALKNNMPIELIAFIRYRPNLLHDFVPTKAITNSACPRTVANIGFQQALGLPAKFEFEVFKGYGGEAFATEYAGFLKIFRELDSIDKIILAPKRAKIPTDPGVLYALSVALANRMNSQNINSIFLYLDRLPAEIKVSCISYATARDEQLCNHPTFIEWAVNSSSSFL